MLVKVGAYASLSSCKTPQRRRLLLFCCCCCQKVAGDGGTGAVYFLSREMGRGVPFGPFVFDGHVG